MSHLFLLLLLGVDFAAEPDLLSLAVRVFSKRMSNTEVVCQSLTQRPTDEVRQARRYHPPRNAPLPTAAVTARQALRRDPPPNGVVAWTPCPRRLSLHCLWLL
jgi:hypothetical protein